MQKIIYATNGESESNGFYDANGNLITAWQDGDCLTFQLERLFKHLGIQLEKRHMPPCDGDYAKKI